MSLFHRSKHPLSFTGGHVTCQICGSTYAHRDNLVKHMKVHSGQTRCPRCHQTYGGMYNLRRHMMNKHGMSKEEVDMVTNKRLSTQLLNFDLQGSSAERD